MNRLTFFAIVHLFLKGHTMLGNRASDEVGKSYTGVPGVDLCAEERNGRRQMLDEKRKNKTRDAEAVPGLIAEPTGTDGFRALCHQFAPSCLPRRVNCISRCNTFWQKMTSVREALHLFSSTDDQVRNTRDTVFPLPTGRWWCSVWWSRRNRCAP